MTPEQRDAVEAAHAAATTLVITAREEFVAALNDADNLLDQAEMAIADAITAVHDLRSIAQLSAQ